MRGFALGRVASVGCAVTHALGAPAAFGLGAALVVAATGLRLVSMPPSSHGGARGQLFSFLIWTIFTPALLPLLAVITSICNDLSV